MERQLFLIIATAADIVQAACGAFGGAGSTDIAAVEYEPMMGIRESVMLKVFYKFLFNAKRSGAAFRNKAYAVAYAEHMGVSRHCLSSECHRKHYIGRFAAYARQ